MSGIDARIETCSGTPEALPRTDVGRWVAWSSDGMRILAVADTLEEAERLAADAGEAPILDRPQGPHRP